MPCRLNWVVLFSGLLLVNPFSALGEDDASERAKRPKHKLNLPPALQAAVDARSELIHTARIEWLNRRSIAGYDPEVQFYTWQCAGEGYLSRRRGDENGRVLSRGAGDSRAQNATEHNLLYQGQQWQHVENEPFAYVGPPPRGGNFEGMAQLRHLGLNPVSWTRDLDQSLEKAIDVQFSSQEGPGELSRVEARFRDPNGTRHRMVWQIDPQRDFNVVRTEVFSEEKLFYHTDIELDQIDGLWFPKRLTQTVAGEKTPSHECEVLSAEFNRPDHPQSLGPADIGIEPGTTVLYQDPSSPKTSGMWDGHQVVTSAEFLGLVAGGHLQFGPNVARELKRREVQAELDDLRQTRERLGVLAPAKQFESDWEAYTRQFVNFYKCDVETVDRAYAILKDCQQRANRYLETNREKFDRLEQRVHAEHERPAASSMPASETAEEYAKLMKSIEAIFENELKPRLSSLLTREQKKMGQFSPASRPAPSR